MKITGPGGPPQLPPLDELPGAETAKPGAPGAAQGVGKAAPEGSFASRLDPAQGATAVGGAAGAAPAGGPSGIYGALAEQLRTGQVTPEQAVERLIEHTVDKRVGPNAPEALREQVRSAVREVGDSDPFLLERIRRLGQAR